MAVRGQKPKPTHLRLVQGNAGHRPVPSGEPVPEGAAEKPKSLKGKAAKLWDEFIAPAFWLTRADSPKALMWCHLHAEFEKSPGNMVASRISQLRALGSELGFDPASRARLGTPGDNGKKKDPAAKYLED
jgi:hypothetical protein